MARKSGSTILQEELYPPPSEPMREEISAASVPAADLDDARLLDLDVEQESPFLRGRKRVSVRRGSLPQKTAASLAWGAVVLTVVIVCCMGVAALYHYGEHSWRFRVESSDDIEVSGLQNVTRAQVIETMGGDIGRNIFFVPLAQRKTQLEQIPWVESASVMRFVPNRLAIEIHERTPVAFARVGSKIMLIDASGALMELPPPGKKKYSFPVIVGSNPGEPLSTRAARMKIYNQFVRELDSDGLHRSQELSEVDLSDPDDVKVLANDPEGAVLVHLGSSDYLNRYKIYVAHLREWRQQFAKLESVDLRYDHQIIVNPDLQGSPKQPPLSMTAAKAAISAGVKQAALLTHQPITKTSDANAEADTPAPVKGGKQPQVKARKAKARPKSAVHAKAVLKTTSTAPASASASSADPRRTGKPSPAISAKDH